MDRSRQPGYVRRELLRGADGGWCDLVIWRDESSFAAAMAAAESDASCGRFFALLQVTGDAGAGIQLPRRVRRYGEVGR